MLGYIQFNSNDLFLSWQKENSNYTVIQIFPVALSLNGNEPGNKLDGEYGILVIYKINS